MLILKIVIYLLSIVLLITLICVGLMGLYLRRTREAGEWDVLIDVFHEYGAKGAFCLAWVIVGFIESILTLKYGFHRPHLPGFALHLWSGSVPFGILISTCVFWITGASRLRRWHRFVAYPCIAATTWMVITGDLLISHL